MSNSMYNILLVEDEENILRFNSRKLIRLGYTVFTATTLSQARKVIDKAQIDLAILDVMLPDGSGFDLCKEIKSKSDTLVLFLSGKAQIVDKIEGLNDGGDYYLTKPYDYDEFVAVVESLLRRVKNSDTIKVGALSIDTVKMIAMVKDKDLLLTPKEFAILHVLIINRGDAITAEELYNKCWISKDAQYSNGVLWAQLSRLRKKLENAGVFYISHQRNKGYVLEVR